MDLKPKEHVYKTSLTWTSERKGNLKCEGKPDISVACAPEFGGHAGIWNPEDMFVGSVELCTMATFLWLAERKRIEIKSYVSEAEGVARMTGGSMSFSELTVRSRVVVTDGKDVKKASQIFGEIEKWCLISNSIVPKVNIKPSITAETE